MLALPQQQSLFLAIHDMEIKCIRAQVERQKLKSEEGSMRLSAQRNRLDRSLNTAEQELQEAQQQILILQVRYTHRRWTDG